MSNMNWENNIIVVRIGNTGEHVMYCLSKLIHMYEWLGSNITYSETSFKKN